MNAEAMGIITLNTKRIQMNENENKLNGELMKVKSTVLWWSKEVFTCGGSREPTWEVMWWEEWQTPHRVLYLKTGM